MMALLFFTGTSTIPTIKTSQYVEKQQGSARGRASASSFTDSYSGESNLDDSEYEDEDESYLGLMENKMAQLILEGKNSPIPQCLSLWGLQDIDLQITPEALDVIGEQVNIGLKLLVMNPEQKKCLKRKSIASSSFFQAMAQRAGAEGVKTIIEKLLFTVKFEMQSDGVKKVEITEDTVLGKAPPIFHYEERKSTQQTDSSLLQDKKEEDTSSSSKEVSKKYSRKVSSNKFTEFDEAIVEGMEL